MTEDEQSQPDLTGHPDSPHGSIPLPVLEEEEYQFHGQYFPSNCSLLLRRLYML